MGLTPDEIERLGADALHAFHILVGDLKAVTAEAIATGTVTEPRVVRNKLAAISKASNRRIAATVTASMRGAARTSLTAEERIYAAARVARLVGPYVPLAESATLDAVLRRGIATVTSMTNIVRTRAEQAVFVEFTDALDSALLSISVGAASPEEAIRRAVDTIARTTPRITYTTAAGERVTSGVYSAVRRAVVTGANQTVARMQESRLLEVGATYVEVSAHSGARPDHAEWQGQVYLFDDLGDATGYGAGDGLGGWNCRHSFWPYFPNLMEPTFEGLAQDEEANAEAYDLSQRQRLCERNIRDYETRATVYDAAGRADDASRSRYLSGKWGREADAVAARRDGARRRDRERPTP